MIENTQKIRRLLPANCLSVFDDFVGFALKGLIEVNRLTFCNKAIVLVSLSKLAVTSGRYELLFQSYLNISGRNQILLHFSTLFECTEYGHLNSFSKTVLS